MPRAAREIPRPILLRNPEGFMLPRGMVRKGRVSVGKFAVLLALATSCARTELFFECTPGEARFCDANGRIGSQVCGYLGYWGTCEANESRPGPNGSGSTSGHSSGSGATTGTGASSGSGAMGGSGGVAGKGASPQGGEGGIVSVGGEGGVPSYGGAGDSEIECSAADCETTVEFERLFGTDGTYFATDVAVNAQGEVAVAVSGRNGTIDFGGSTAPMIFDALVSIGAYLARFDGDGTAHWATRLDAYQDYLLDVEISRIDLDDEGDLFVAGTSTFIPDLNASLFRYEGTSSDLPVCETGFPVGAGKSIVGTGNGGFVAVGLDGGTDFEASDAIAWCDAFESDCGSRWSAEFSSDAPAVAGSVASSVALDSSGNVIFVGTSGGPLEVDDGAIGSPSQYSIVLVKLAPSGARIFSRAFAGKGALRRDAQAVAVDSHDNIFVAGTHDGPLDFGAGSLPNESGSYLAKFNPKGRLLWAKQLAGSNRLGSLDLDVDPSDNVLVAATFEGSLEKPVAVSAVDRDGIVLKVDSNGEAVWVEVFGGANDQSARGVATDPDGNVFVVGGLEGPEAGAPSRAFVAKLAP